MRTVLVIGSLGAFFNLYQLQALYPQLVDRFGTTVSEAGWLNMASLLGMMITAPVTGAMTKYSSPSRLLILGFLALATLNASAAFSTSQYWLFILRLGQGIVIPLLLTSTMKLVSARPGSFVSLYVTGTIVGSTFSRMYPAWSVDAIGWELGFLSSGCLMVLSAVTIHFLSDASGAAPANRSERHQVPQQYARQAFADRTLFVAYLAGFALLFTQSAVFTALGLRLSQEPYLWDSEQIGTIYLACLPALFFVLTARFVRRYMSETAVAASLISLIWGSLWIIGGTSTSIIIGVALFATGTYMFQTVTTRVLSSSRTVPVAVATGTYLSFYYLGGAIGASLSAYAFAASSWSGVVACIAITQAFIFCLVLCVRHSSMERFNHARVKAWEKLRKIS